MKSPVLLRFAYTLFAVLACTADTTAQINYPDFRTVTGLRFVGTAVAHDSVIDLNTSQPKVAGGIWFAEQQPIANGFTTRFQFQVTDTGGQDDATGEKGGDGIAFVIQNAEPAPLGGAGGMLGYDPIRNSIAIEFDTYSNNEPGLDDLNGNHVAVHTTGTGNNSASNAFAIARNTNIPNLSDGRIHEVTIVYISGELRVYLDGCQGILISLPLDVQRRIALNNGRAWVGITGSTGSAWERHILYSWAFNARPLNTPLRIGLCAGAVAALSPPGAFSSYRWSTGSTTRTINVRNPGRYTVTVIDSLPCIPSEFSFTFDVVTSSRPRPSIALRDTMVLCSGDELTLDAGEYSTWTWSTGAVARTIKVTTPGLYWVSVMDSLGCPGSDTVLIVAGTRPPVPVIAISGPSTFCTGDSIVLGATAGYASYRWNNGATTRSLVVRDGGSYSVTVTNASGCPATSAPVRVSVLPRPYPVIQPSSATNFCRGDSVVLDAGAGYYTYRWSNGATTQTIIVDSSGLFTVAVTAANGCIGISSPISVTVSDRPSPEIVAEAARFCNGDTVVLRTRERYASYAWSNGASTESISVTSDGVFSVVAGDRNGCRGASAPFAFVLDSINQLHIETSGPTSMCEGSTITLSGPDGLASYRWSNGATSRSIDVTTGGTYSLEVIDSSGCRASDSIVIQSFAQPHVIASADTTICAGSSITLSASGGERFAWSADNDFSCSDCAVVQVAPVVTTRYRVVATNAGGCSDTAFTMVTVNPTTRVTVHAVGDHNVFPGQTVDVPVNIDGSVADAAADDITLDIAYSSATMLLSGISLGTDMLTGWQMVPLVDSAGHFQARFRSTDGRTIRDGQTLLTMRMQTFIGLPRRSVIVPTLYMADRSCATITSVAGSVTIDSLCGMPQRLISALAGSFALLPIAPNPFNPSTNISLEIGADADAMLEILDAAGARVSVLHRGPLAPGLHRFHWDATAIPSGVYYARAASGEWSAIEVLMLVK